MAKLQLRACLKTNILSYLHFSQSAIAVRPRADPDGGPKGWIWHCRRAVHQPESAASMITPLAKGDIPPWVGVFGQALTSVMGKAVVKTAQAIPEDRLCFEHALRFGAWHVGAHP